jgi:CubicO group peptidase (beta-lactamase class C family)
MIRKNLIIAILCLFTFQALQAQMPGEKSYKDESVMPGGKKGERIKSLIATANSNDPDQISRFINEECTQKFRNIAPMEEHINVLLDFRRATGGVDFHSIRTYVPERKETVVILKDRNFESWRAFVMTLDMIQRICERDIFSGTVLIAKDDEILFTHAYGEASKRFHAPNNLDTKFNIGSMNKMFTATAVTQLVEKGLLSFEETIDKYVDETWLPKETTSKITVHHLLTHTSGLGSYFNETYMKGAKGLYRKVNDFKPLVKGEKLAFEPGKRFRYSNTGMLLLGVVIESVTGQSYFEYIHKNIYEPAGMKNSDCYEMDYPVENLAIGYSPDLKSKYGWQNNFFKHVIKGGPAGGGFSTVGDLHRFARAIQKAKLVSTDSLKALWKDHSGEGYGYGFGITEGPSGKVVGHSGGFSGINGVLDIYLDKGYIVAALSNYDNGASPVVRKIGQLLARLK